MLRKLISCQVAGKRKRCRRSSLYPWFVRHSPKRKPGKKNAQTVIITVPGVFLSVIQFLAVNGFGNGAEIPSVSSLTVQFLLSFLAQLVLRNKSGHDHQYLLIFRFVCNSVTFFCSCFDLVTVGYLWYNKAILTERVFFMPRIIPIKDLKDTSGVSELCHSMKEPIYITKNGYGDMVLMSMELFEEQRKKWEMYSEIELSEEQIAQGKTKNAKDALASVRKKYGL